MLDLHPSLWTLSDWEHLLDEWVPLFKSIVENPTAQLPHTVKLTHEERAKVIDDDGNWTGHVPSRAVLKIQEVGSDGKSFTTRDVRIGGRVQTLRRYYNGTLKPPSWWEELLDNDNMAMLDLHCWRGRWTCWTSADWEHLLDEWVPLFKSIVE